MVEYFDKVRSAPSTYVDSNDGMMTDVRLVIYRHGEDPQKVIAAFYAEHREANFAIIPLPSFGNPPRRDLCSPRSSERRSHHRGHRTRLARWATVASLCRSFERRMA